MSPIQTATLQAYAASYSAFERWCRANGHKPLPASPRALVAYLSQLSAAGKAPATLDRVLVGIGYVQRQLDPTWEPHAIIREVVAKARQGFTQSVASTPVTDTDLHKILEVLRNDVGLRALRDSAILTLGWNSAFRRSELAGLDVRDVRFGLGRLSIGNLVLLSSKDPEICAVNAVQQWVFAANLTSGALFRAISKAGNVLERRLNGKSISLIVKRAATRAGLDASHISSNSLRMEYVNETAMENVDE
jgi:site-specific recombinase XerD